MIKPFTIEDLEILTSDVGVKFFSECNLPGGFNLEVFKTNWINLIKNNIGAIWASYIGNELVGALGGILYPDLINADMVATECFWYVLPQHRRTRESYRLLLLFHEWAKQMKAKRIIMAHLIGENTYDLQKFYERLGFKPTEIHYVKNIWP